MGIPSSDFKIGIFFCFSFSFFVDDDDVRDPLGEEIAFSIGDEGEEDGEEGEEGEEVEEGEEEEEEEGEEGEEEDITKIKRNQLYLNKENL